LGHSRDSQIGDEGRAGAKPAPAGNSLNSKPSASEDAARAALLRLIEQARTELEVQLHLLRQQDTASRNLAAIDVGDARVRELDALRERLTAGPGTSLTAIRAEVGVAVAAASIGAVQASAAASGASSAAQFTISQAEYRRATADWDRKVAQTGEADRGHFEGARALAHRLGVDVSGFEAERRQLEEEREAARRTGDKVGERRADLGIAENTYGVMAAGLPRITDSEERRRHEEQMREQQRIIELRRAAVDAQVELEAGREAGNRNLDLKETNRSRSSQPDRATGSDPATQIIGEKPATLIAAGIGDATRAQARRAAAPIRDAYGKSANSVDDFSLADAERRDLPAKAAQAAPTTLAPTASTAPDGPPATPLPCSSKSGPICR
jgi:hypothetical protein